MSLKLAVIGDPIAHSSSPRIQGEFLRLAGITGEYRAHHIRTAELEEFVRFARRELDGFNITIPHKRNILPFLDELDPYAARCGAVNTVCVREGRLIGYNTDGDGIRAALQRMGVDFPGNRIALLGAGGAAQSISCKALECGAEKLRIFCRNPVRGAELAAGDPRAEVLPFSALAADNCGSWADAAVSFFVGLTLYLAVRGASLAGFNGVISNLVSSFVISFLTIFAVSHHLGDSMEMIVIGNIMPLIPGTGLTNALRDMISGDTIAGILRFCEACIMAFAIAAGYILASMALGGIGL